MRPSFTKPLICKLLPTSYCCTVAGHSLFTVLAGHVQAIIAPQGKCTVTVSYPVKFLPILDSCPAALKKQYPDLSTTDLKLCAYLRINLTTKEIAQSLGISMRGVETSRYRLRKELSIPGEIGLYDFLIGIADVEKNWQRLVDS